MGRRSGAVDENRESKEMEGRRQLDGRMHKQNDRGGKKRCRHKRREKKRCDRKK